MKIIWKIAKAELQTLFFSPLAWLMLVVFGITVFGAFYDRFDILVRTQELGDQLGNVTRELYIDQRGTYASILEILYFFFPLLTMGLISRELGSGSMKLLDSSPVSTSQVVCGKYLCMCIFSLLLIAILFIPVVLGIFTVENLEMKAIFTGLLGMYLLMCTYSAIGLYMSSLSTYPIVAAVGTLGILAALNMIGTVWQEYDFMRDITYWLSISSRIVSFLTGIIASADVIYYLLVIILFVALTWVKLRFTKVIWPVWKKACVYTGMILVVLVVGYVSSLPKMRFYADGTEDKRNTLSEASQEVMTNIKGKVKVTTYVNVLHKNCVHMMPISINADKARFEQYMRFHPEMELDYVYYYGKTTSPSQAATVYGKNLTMDSTARFICRINNLDVAKLMTPDEVAQVCPIDLASEDNPVIKVIEVEGKGVRPLRLFEDMMVLPSEPEISAAFKGMSMELPLVAFLTGRGAPDIASRTREGFDAIFNTPYVRGSLINQGFRVQAVSVSDGELPEDVAVLVIANPLEAYDEQELKLVHDYIAEGGNLLLMGDAGNENIMNEIALPLGITFTEGYLVEPHRNGSEILPHVAVCEVQDAAFEVNTGFRSWKQEGIMLPLKMTTTLQKNTAVNADFEFLPLFMSAPNSWIKREKVNLLDGELKPDESKGEKQASYVTVAGLRRMIGEKEQRVMVTGDAEWLSNMGLSTQYPGIRINLAGLGVMGMNWMVYGEAPINPERRYVADTKIDYRDVDLEWIYYLYVWLLPLLMAFVGFMLYYRRNKQ